MRWERGCVSVEVGESEGVGDEVGPHLVPATPSRENRFGCWCLDEALMPLESVRTNPCDRDGSHRCRVPKLYPRRGRP